MPPIYTGKVIGPEGPRTVVATRIPRKASEHVRLSVEGTIDSLSPLPGSNPPIPNETGWLVRPVSGDLVGLGVVRSVLTGVYHIKDESIRDVPRPMTLEEVIQITGKGAVRGFEGVPDIEKQLFEGQPRGALEPASWPEDELVSVA